MPAALSEEQKPGYSDDWYSAFSTGLPAFRYAW